VSPGAGGQQYGATTPTVPQQPTMSRDELIARLKAQRDAFQQQNPSAVSIVPPIPGESQPVPTPTPVPNAPNLR